jgi:hypothetical protein
VYWNCQGFGKRLARRSSRRALVSGSLSALPAPLRSQGAFIALDRANEDFETRQSGGTCQRRELRVQLWRYANADLRIIANALPIDPSRRPSRLSSDFTFSLHNFILIDAQQFVLTQNHRRIEHELATAKRLPCRAAEQEKRSIDELGLAPNFGKYGAN